MADQDIKMLIERIMAEARTHQSARFSNEIYADEPILKTGRQMQNFLPDQYRKMREISRWQDDPKGGAGRWLSEAELLYLACPSAPRNRRGNVYVLCLPVSL